MHSTGLPALTLDEIDDLLYFTRVNEVQELQQTIAELAQKYQCTQDCVLEACVDPQSGNTALHYGSANGLVELLSTLLTNAKDSPSAGGDLGGSTFVNRQNKEGNTALHWAAYNGHLAVVKLLIIAANADMWIKNAAGHLAMFEAERADKSEVVQYLLEAGGKAVERGGREGQVSAEDVADVQGGEASSGAQGEANEELDLDAHPRTG